MFEFLPIYDSKLVAEKIETKSFELESKRVNGPRKMYVKILVWIYVLHWFCCIIRYFSKEYPKTYKKKSPCIWKTNQ